MLFKRVTCATILSFFFIFGSAANSADHMDAPLLIFDRGADLTDLYVFVSNKYDGTSQQMLTVVLQTWPYSEPGAGPIYARFPDDVRYNIHITDPNTGASAITYSFLFSDPNASNSPGLKNPNTILSYGKGANGADIGPLSRSDDVNRNFTQFYKVTRTVGATGKSREIGSGLVTAPPNLGPNTTPLYNDASGHSVSGTKTFAELDQYTKDAVHELPSGEVVFAGPREDGFYADLAGIFDLIDARIFTPSPEFPETLGQQGGGPDTLRGFNTLAMAIQIPLTGLNAFTDTFTTNYFGQPITSTGLGVYASAERQRINSQRANGEALKTGPWIQIERVANPLLGILFLSQESKDRFNQSSPVDDQRFRSDVANPELAVLINQAFPDIPAFSATGRRDLVNIYIPDVIRVDTTTGPVPLPGQPGFNRLSIAGGDTTAGKSSGWPNGRRLGDDVVDIVFSLLRTDPNNGVIRLAGDNVNANDQVFNQVFPYAAIPHSGAGHEHD